MHRRTGAFKLWHSRRLLRVPWTVRRFNQSILKKINTEYSLEGLVLKLKFWYFGHLVWRADSLEKTPRLGKIEGKRRRGDRGWDGWVTQWARVWANFGRQWRTGKSGMLQCMGSQSRTGLNNWTATTKYTVQSSILSFHLRVYILNDLSLFKNWYWKKLDNYL